MKIKIKIPHKEFLNHTFPHVLIRSKLIEAGMPSDARGTMITYDDSEDAFKVIEWTSSDTLGECDICHDPVFDFQSYSGAIGELLYHVRCEKERV